MQALFTIRTLHHIICLPLFNIYNWFILQNPDIFFFIPQNPDFINVVKNVDFAKSRFFYFVESRFFYFAISQNLVRRKMQILWTFTPQVAGGLVAPHPPKCIHLYCAMTDGHCMLCLRHNTRPRPRDKKA